MCDQLGTPDRGFLDELTQFGAGIVAAGMGSKLVTDAAVKAGDWTGIEAQVRSTVEAIKAFRAK